MRLMLFSMPMGDMTQPYTAMPTLTGQLRPRGIDVVQRDYGIEFAHYWSSPARARELMDQLRDAIQAGETGQLAADAWEDYVDLKILAAQLAPHIDHLDAALGELKRPELLDDLPRLSLRLRLLTAYQNLIGFVERRALSAGSFQALSVAAGVALIERPPPLYHRFIDDHLLPDLLATAADAIGISITYPRQLYPSLVACAAIKRARPELPIVLGGAYLTTVIETFQQRPELQRWWDYCVRGEGETALFRLLEALAGRGTLDDVPNLVYHAGGEVKRSARLHDEDIHALETPDFCGLNIDRYLAPQPVFLLPVARGCYMRCTFCSISYATQVYRCRTGSEIVEDIRNVQRQFGPGARNFNFSIDVMAPKHLTDMAQSIIDSGLDIAWDAEIRFDRTLRSEIISLMKQAGCQHLRFGLESAVDRIRERMDKRITMDRVNEILDDCRRENIKASAMVIIGFPGETEAEARQTFQFLHDNNDRIRFFALNVYTVSRGSVVAARPSDFGVMLAIRRDRLVQPSWDFTILDGIPTRRARQLVGEFRTRLMEPYPLADEGFSVGIGGAFTFLVTSRWTWDQLQQLDAVAAGRDAAPLTPTAVPAVGPRVEIFESPYVFADGAVAVADGPVTYCATPRHSLVRLQADAAELVRAIDGRRTVAELAAELAGADAPAVIDTICTFLTQLQTRGVVATIAADA